MNVKEYLKIHKQIKSNKITIVGVHPHSGREGDVISVDDTVAGVGLRIRLDSSTGCYIYDMKNVEWL